MEPTEETRLSNELLAAKEPKSPKKPKRNGKEALRANILKVVEKYELELGYSDTKLKRMNKEQLTKVLAEVMEESVKIDMAKSVGVDPRAGGKVVTLGALRMLHNICATGFEKGFNAFGPDLVGLKCNGFAQSLIATGAFEVEFNDRVVFSKLETGRMPRLDELLQALHGAGLKEYQAGAN